MRPMPSKAWMAMSSTGVICALTMRATSDPTLCRAAGTEAVAADHDPDLEADDRAPDQVVSDLDEGKNSYNADYNLLDREAGDILDWLFESISTSLTSSNGAHYH